jgi:hypothetical protein
MKQSSATGSTSQRLKPRLAIAGSGLAAGLISSLAISALILLVEKVTGLPMGTFYLVLASALLQTKDYTASTIALGFLMHLAAGSILGLVLSIPFAMSKRLRASGRYAPAYGLAAGFAIWLALFLPITFGIVLPLINSLGQQAVIRQPLPGGGMSTIATGELLSMMDRVIAGSLAFNMFYGLLAAILARSMSEAYLQRHQVIL